MKAWAVAVLAFCLGTGVTVLCVALFAPPAWRVISGTAGILVASKLAAAAAAASHEKTT